MDVQFKITPEAILQPDAAEMLILVLYLYGALPQFTPRAVVEFTGKLNEKQASAHFAYVGYVVCVP